MTERDEVINAYFDWLYEIMCQGRHSNNLSYRKVMTQLHSTKFRYKIRNDKNRASDGIGLRRRYALLYNDDRIYDYVDGPCSVLEMMIALAIKCEETWMDDPDYGDRTSQWFWNMMTNLGLGAMNDDVFDRKETEFIIRRFIDRDYESDGKGGLFWIRNSPRDLRNVEIWYQLCWYLDTIT